jgi:hypothetical protein
MWRTGWAPNSIPIYIQQDATLHSLFIPGNCSTCFGWYFHPSSGGHKIVSTASGICHTVTAICRYREELEPVWVCCGWRMLTMHGPINVKSPNNTSKWQMGFNSAFKGLILFKFVLYIVIVVLLVSTCRVGFQNFWWNTLSLESYAEQIATRH